MWHSFSVWRVCASLRCTRHKKEVLSCGQLEMLFLNSSYFLTCVTNFYCLFISFLFSKYIYDAMCQALFMSASQIENHLILVTTPWLGSRGASLFLSRERGQVTCQGHTSGRWQRLGSLGRGCAGDADAKLLGHQIKQNHCRPLNVYSGPGSALCVLCRGYHLVLSTTTKANVASILQVKCSGS